MLLPAPDKGQMLRDMHRPPPITPEAALKEQRERIRRLEQTRHRIKRAGRWARIAGRAVGVWRR